jgi:PEP-CTERM motif
MKTMYLGIRLNNKIPQLFGAFSAGIFFLSAGLLQAQTTAGLIDVQFSGNSVGNDYGGGGLTVGPAQTGAAVIGSAGDVWNAFNDSSFSFSSYPSGLSAGGLALNYVNGSSSGATLSISDASGGSYNANEPNWGNTSAFTTAGSPYSNLMQDEIYSTPAATVTLSGLAASQNYELIVYSAGDSNLGGDTVKIGTFTVNGVTQTTSWNGTTSTLINGTTYDIFSATSDGSGNLVINFGGTPAAAGVNTETDFNGFQLIAVPEPSTWAMLAIGGVMLLGYRRSFRRA